jgi:transcriptional regulator with XRE-family HTH domain
MYAHVDDRTFPISQREASQVDTGIKNFASITCAFMTSTLGFISADYVAQRGATSNWAFSLTANRLIIPGPIQRSPAEGLSRIREIFKPTITEVAALFGVSRQTVYDWQSGKGISDRHADKLEEIANAADLFADSGLPFSTQIVRRKLAGGRTLFDLFREGGSAQEATHSLIKMIQHELEQRKALGARLANRKRPALDQADLGIPMLDEQA